MIKKIFYIAVIILLLGSVISFATGTGNETLNSNDPNYQIELNDMLQTLVAGLSQTSNNVNTVQGYFTNNLLPSKQGGTGADLSACIQGSTPYYSIVGVESCLPPGTSGQFYTSQGGSANPIWSSVAHGIQIFNASGTFTAPAGVTKILVSMVGGGAGGWSNDTTNSGGNGGGGGASLLNYPYTVIAGNSYTVTVGTGGAGGVYSSGGITGGNGGTSSFDSTISVHGGSAGANLSTGGLGATSTSANSLNASGTTGGGALPVIATTAGGNGAAPATNNGGAGGGSIWGQGGSGGGSNASGTSPLANTGAGGGGPGKGASHLDGSAGSAGCVIIVY